MTTAVRPVEPIRTSALTLVPPDPAYCDDIYRYASSADFCRYIDAEPMESSEQAAEFLTHLKQENDVGNRKYWVALDNASQTAVGTLGLIFMHAERHRVADFGYGFAPQCWGTGIFQEASGGVIAHAFEEMGLGRLQAITRADNIAAIRSIEKLGFRQEGTLEAFYQTGAGRADAVILALFPGC